MDRPKELVRDWKRIAYLSDVVESRDQVVILGNILSSDDVAALVAWLAEVEVWRAARAPVTVDVHYPAPGNLRVYPSRVNYRPGVSIHFAQLGGASGVDMTPAQARTLGETLVRFAQIQEQED